MIAGCTGDGVPGDGDSSGGGTDGGESGGVTVAESDLSVQLNGPEEVEYGESFTLTVSAENTGGEAGTFDGVLRSASESLSVELDVELTVPPGEVATAETDPIEPSGIESHDFELYARQSSTATVNSTTVEYEEESETPILTRTVEVVPAEVAAGESVVIVEALETTFAAVEFAQHLWLQETYYGGGVEPVVAPEGSVFAIYSVEITNTGENHYLWDLVEDVEVPAGGVYEHNRQRVVELTESGMEGTRGESLHESKRIDSGETVSGYVLATLPVSTAVEEAPLYLQADEETATAEYRVPFTSEAPRSFPNLELADVTVPSSVPSGEGYELEFTIANTGDGRGVAKQVLQLDYQGWDPLQTVNSGPYYQREVEPGGETTITVTNATDVTGEYTYRLQPYGDTWTTTFTESE